MDDRSTAGLDLDYARSRFPGLASEWVYMDNAGGSLPLGSVIDSIADYMRHWPVQLGATYAPSAEAGRRVDAGRAAIARLMSMGGHTSVDPETVVLGASTSSLFSRVARGLAPGIRPGDEIVVTAVDHEANVSPWHRLQRHGARIRTWPLNLDSLALEARDLEPLLSDRTRLVCCTHASNILGSVTDLGAISRLTKDAGARLCVDGVAYAPHRAMAVADAGVDFYAFSLYKVFGPHCAALFGRREALRELDNQNHRFFSDDYVPGKLEPGAFPYELVAAATAIPDYIEALGRRSGGDAFAAIAAHERALSGRLLDYLGTRPDARIMGSAEADAGRLPTISFVLSGRPSASVPPVTDEAGLGIRFGHFYAPALMTALGLEPDDGVIRISLAHYNSLEEVGRLIDVLDTKVRPAQ